jgi:hypothetical protein
MGARTTSARLATCVYTLTRPRDIKHRSSRLHTQSPCQRRAGDVIRTRGAQQSRTIPAPVRAGIEASEVVRHEAEEPDHVDGNARGGPGGVGASAGGP